MVIGVVKTKTMSDLNNLYRAYSAVHNSEVSKELYEAKDIISGMTLGQLNTADLQELAEEILEDMFEAGWSRYETADIITDILVEASEQSQSQLKDQKIECIGEAFEAALDHCHTEERFTQYRQNKKIQENFHNKSNEDRSAKRLHEAIIAPEKKEIKEGLIELITEKTDKREKMADMNPAKKEEKLRKANKLFGAPLRKEEVSQIRQDWSNAYSAIYEKKADKDYDGDGKVESGKDEYMGSRDKAIKKAMNPAKEEEKLRKDDKLFGSPKKVNEAGPAFPSETKAQAKEQGLIRKGKMRKADSVKGSEKNPGLKMSRTSGYNRTEGVQYEGQGYNDRLDDSLGSKDGKKSQSKKDRRDESEGMEKSKGKRKFSGDKSMDEDLTWSQDEIAAIEAKVASWNEDGPAYPSETKAQAKEQGLIRKGKIRKADSVKGSEKNPGLKMSRTSGYNRQD